MRTSKYSQKAKPIAECTDEELRMVCEYARSHAVRMKRAELANDFASFLLEDLVKQGTLYYNLRWRWAQFLRDTMGNITNKKGSAKSNAIRTQLSIEPKPGADGKLMESFPIPDPKPLPDTSAMAFAGLCKLNERERAVLLLREKWGLSLEEVAEVFNVSRERVRQIERVALEKSSRELRVWHPNARIA